MGFNSGFKGLNIPQIAEVAAMLLG